MNEEVNRSRENRRAATLKGSDTQLSVRCSPGGPTRIQRRHTSRRDVFCSTFECIKLYCVPASIAPDVPMSGAARVNEPFPGPLAVEYYIDNRNYLPSTRDGWQDVSFETLAKKRNREDQFRCTATDTHAIINVAYYFFVLPTLQVYFTKFRGPYLAFFLI